MDDNDPSTTPILSYSRSSPRRWPRILIPFAIFLSLAIISFYAYPRLSVWYARRQGLRETQTWYQLARNSTLPSNTLVYSERPDDFGDRHHIVTLRRGPLTRQFVSFAMDYPTLRQIGYTAEGAPVLIDFDVVYAHEHLASYPASPTGSSPQLIAVTYNGPNPDGSPDFGIMAYQPPTQIPILFHGGATTPPSPPDRPLTHLRLYAGQPRPSDPARFSIPFSCDSGAGHFDFQLRTSPSSIDQLAHTLLLRWDPPPSTNPL